MVAKTEQSRSFQQDLHRLSFKNITVNFNSQMRLTLGRTRGELNTTPFRGFSEFFPIWSNISTWSFQWLFIYPSRAFWDKLGNNRLLWLRDMTSWVVSGQAIFEKKYMFFRLVSTIKVKFVDKINNNNKQQHIYFLH